MAYVLEENAKGEETLWHNPFSGGCWVNPFELDGAKDAIKEGVASGELMELTSTHKIRRLSPAFELFSALAEADILPTALFDELQQDFWRTRILNHHTLDSLELPFVKRGLVLRSGLTEAEVKTVEEIIEKMTQDGVLMELCNVKEALTIQTREVVADDEGGESRDDDVGFLIGESVTLHALEKAAHLNGRKGTILGRCKDGRYPVEVELLAGETKRISIKLENLKRELPKKFDAPPSPAAPSPTSVVDLT